jgi:hypothetical protein
MPEESNLIVMPAPAMVEETEPEVQIDAEFPFGRPEVIDWDELDKEGHPLIKEINLRPWMKSTEYCSGHPLDRPKDEQTGWGSRISDVLSENVYVEISKLDMAYLRGAIPDVYYRRRKLQLRDEGATRFYLNINVYNLVPFMQWIRTFSVTLLSLLGSDYNPIVVRMNPLRPGLNYTIYWDYWSMDERVMIHDLALRTLQQFPV